VFGADADRCLSRWFSVLPLSSTSGELGWSRWQETVNNDPKQQRAPVENGSTLVM
jgi:hypothetical protein